VSLLIRCEAPVNCTMSSQSITPLCLAAQNGHHVVAKMLLEHGADVDLGCPLYIAILNSHSDIVDLLLDCGANPNMAPAKGLDPPLALAVRKRLRRVIPKLLARKADADLAGRDGRSALGLADAWGDPEVLSNFSSF